MKREGKTLQTLAPGDRRRVSDGKNAWRKMTPNQRLEFLMFLGEGEHDAFNHFSHRLGSLVKTTAERARMEVK